MAKDHVDLLGDGSLQSPSLALGDLNNPLTVTGPSQEFPVGAFPPRDGENIKMDAVVSLGQAPAAGAAYATVDKGSQPGYVKVLIWKSTFAAADAATVTKIHLVVVKGSSVTK